MIEWLRSLIRRTTLDLAGPDPAYADQAREIAARQRIIARRIALIKARARG